jgi:hypothetical protein
MAVGTLLAASFILALLSAAFGAVPSAGAATAIGKVTRLHGDARGTVEGISRPIAADDAVYLDESVVTGADGRLEVALDDDTVLTVGERASLKLDAFVYRADASVVKVSIAGAFRFVSGKLAGSARDAAITAPFAVIAVRGTDVWGGPIDGAFGVFLFEGAVSVTNAGGTADLTAAGQGVNFDTPAAAPGAVTLWPQDKVARAAATVTFP